MNQGSKKIIIISGPNGSGKSTFADAFFGMQEELVYINPDLIARGLSPSIDDDVFFQAGRIMLKTVKDMVLRGESFAFESTLSGKTWHKILTHALEKGYSVTIYFLYTSNVSLNIKRVKERAKRGGHFIQPADIKRRFPKCFDNFWNIYRSLANEWFVFDNTKKKPRLIMNSTDFLLLPKIKQEEFIENFMRIKK